MNQDFDRFAKDYREVHTKSIRHVAGADSFYFAEYKVFEVKKYEQDEHLQILDLGCGDGVTDLFFSRHFPHFEITGIDVSSESIAVATQKNILKALFKTYDGEKIPFADEQFDIVFLAGVLHHVAIDQQQSIVAEAARVLRPTGRLYIFEHNPFNPLTRYLVNTCEFDKGVQLLPLKRTKEIIVKSGLKINDVKFIIFFPRNAFFKLFHRIEKYLQKWPVGGQYFIRALKN